MGAARERDLVKLEMLLAQVMSLSDLSSNLLNPLQRTIEASGTWLFAFGPGAQPFILGGSMAEAMREYTVDIFAADPFQAYARALPRTAFLSNERNDFDAPAYLKSGAYADFYKPRSIQFVQGIYPTGLPYGAPHMFGIAIAMRDLDAYSRTMLPVLRRLEAPFRAAARRILRLRDLETQRDVLQFVTADPGLSAIWDDSSNLVCLSPRAAERLAHSGRDTLQRAVEVAVRQCMVRNFSRNTYVLTRPIEVCDAHGVQWLAELSWVRTPEHRRYVLAHLRPGLGAAADLTRTERRVLALLARAHSNREIGQALFVSEQTVKTHVSSILAKLGVSSRARAVASARALGLEDIAGATAPGVPSSAKRV